MTITLVTVETMYHALARRSLQETLAQFDADEVLIFSDQHVLDGAKHVEVGPFPSVSDYCEFMMHGMLEHVNTDHILFVQWDAMARDRRCWTNDFLAYDYIGAPWPWEREGYNIGNGGFSLRSRRLLEALQDTSIRMDPSNPKAVNEDQVIGVAFRDLLESKYGIKYPSTSLAEKFSYELGNPTPSFGFHGYWNVLKLMPKHVVNFFFEYRPPNIFKEFYRCHHTILALAQTGRLELLQLAATEILQVPNFLHLMAWLSSEDFPNKQQTMSIILNAKRS